MSEHTTCDSLFCVMSRGHAGRHVDKNGRYFEGVQHTPECGVAHPTLNITCAMEAGHECPHGTYIIWSAK